MISYGPMYKALRVTMSFLLTSVCLSAAAPAITGVVNSASLLPPGVPNYGIAQGSIFNVFGSNLGPASLTEASLPLPPSLGGTSITVTIGTTTVTAPMFYSYQSQLAAILPSNTPVGTGTLTVSYNSVTGTAPITVVQSNVGIYTVNQSGSGPGVVTFANYQVVTNSNSVKAGDVLIIWATGLGPITTSDAQPPVSVDLGTPIQIYVGGMSSQVLYRGRSSFAGLDQINFTVPQGVAPGCAVSLVIQTNSLVSNNTALPVSSNGGTCTDPVVSPQSSLNLSGKSTYSLGTLGLLSSTTSTASPTGGQNTTQTTLGAIASFQSITQAQVSSGSASLGITSLGSCSVITSVGTPTGGGSTLTPLDAGVVTVTPPSAAPVTLKAISTGLYQSALTALPAGAYQFTGAGGTGVSPFSVTYTSAAPLTWTNQSIASTAIDRTKPLTYTWSGGDPKGYAEMELTSEGITGTSVTSAIVTCTAPVSAGQFSVPTWALLSLIPTTSNSLFSIGTASLSGFSYQLLTIPGLDLGLGASESFTTVPASFK
jgi:uncharacterized protein (TIGR03437 family)